MQSAPPVKAALMLSLRANTPATSSNPMIVTMIA
jgi:hypothetical protein